MVVVTSIIAIAAVSKKKYSLCWRLKIYCGKCCCASCCCSTKPKNLSLIAGDGSTSTDSTTGPGDTTVLKQKVAEAKSSRTQRHQIQLQNMLSVYVIGLFCSFGLCFMVYEGITFAGVYRYDTGGAARVQDFTVAMGCSTCLLALWAIAYKWYDSLPSIQRYALCLIGFLDWLSSWLCAHFFTLSGMGCF